MLVKCLELADEGPRVLGGGKSLNCQSICSTKKSLVPYLQNDSHPVVDVVDHLVVLAHNHLAL